MTWLQRYRLSSYVRRSFWILPVLGMILALLAVRLLHRIESAMGWQLQYDPASAMMLLGTLAASMFTLIGAQDQHAELVPADFKLLQIRDCRTPRCAGNWCVIRGCLCWQQRRIFAR